MMTFDDAPRPPWADQSDLLRAYYDTEWGLPVTDEQGLYERLCLEGFQAGLAWSTILSKRPAFREAFAGFDPEVVAKFGNAEIETLMSNKRIIRNGPKIRSVINNAKATLAARADGGLPKILWSYQPESTPIPATIDDIPSVTKESQALAKDLKKRGFTFVGPKTVHALMEAVGIVDSHLRDSPKRNISGLWNPDGSRRANPVIPLDEC